MFPPTLVGGAVLTRWRSKYDFKPRLSGMKRRINLVEYVRPVID